MAKAENRDRAIEDGYYDGRFRPKTQDTKKQKMAKRNGKNKKWFDEED